MFDVEYKGGNTVVISTKKTKLVADPKLSLVGLKDVLTKGAVELATESRFALNSEDAVVVIDSPGEYETGDFSIVGLAAQRHMDSADIPKAATIYRIEIGDARVGLIGNIDGKLEEDQLESLGVLDLLILPVGGNGYTLDATSAAQLARTIDCKVVIPIHYADPALSYEVPQDEVGVFVKEFGGEVEETSKLKIKNAHAIPAAQTVIKLLRS